MKIEIWKNGKLKFKKFQILKIANLGKCIFGKCRLWTNKATWSWMGKCNAIGTWFEEKWEIDLANEEP